MKKLNKKQIQILKKYNCDINKINRLLGGSISPELNTHKISLVIPPTSRFLGGVNNREILINKIMKELKDNE